MISFTIGNVFWEKHDNYPHFFKWKHKFREIKSDLFRVVELERGWPGAQKAKLPWESTYPDAHCYIP